MFGYQPQPPYYPPMMGYPPQYNSSDDALKLARAMIKEGRRIKRDLQAEKKPEEKKDDKKKTGWAALDTLHIFLGMMTLAPIIGLIWRQVFLQLIK